MAFWNPDIRPHARLRRLAAVFQSLTPQGSCLMLHNFGCNLCTKKPQSKTHISNIELNFRVGFVDIAASRATK